MFTDPDGGTAFHMPEDDSAYYLHQFIQDPMVECPLDFSTTLMTPTTTTPNSSGAESPHHPNGKRVLGADATADGPGSSLARSQPRTHIEPQAWLSSVEKKHSDDHFSQQFSHYHNYGASPHTDMSGVPLSPSSADSHRNAGFDRVADADIMSAYTHSLDHHIDNAIAYAEMDPVPGQPAHATGFKPEPLSASEPPHQRSALSAQLAQVKAESADRDDMWNYAESSRQFHEMADASIAHNMPLSSDFGVQRHSVSLGALGSYDGLTSPHPSELDLPGSLGIPSSDSGLPESMPFDSVEPMSPTSRPPVGYGPSSLSRNSSVASMSHPLSGAMPISIGRSNNLAGVFKGTPTYRSRQSSLASSGVAFSLNGADLSSSYGSIPVKDLTVSRAGSVREDSPLGSTVSSTPSSSLGFTPGSAGSASGSGGPILTKEEPKRRASAANMHNGQSDIECTNCRTKKTPLWRRNPEGEPLCNACGLFLKLHGETRPLRLKSDVIKKRNRANTKVKKQQQQQQQQQQTQMQGKKQIPGTSSAAQSDSNGFSYSSGAGSLQSSTNNSTQPSPESDQPTSPQPYPISRPPSVQPIQSASHLQRLRSLGHSHHNSMARDLGSAESSPQSLMSEADVSPRHVADNHSASAFKQVPISVKPVEATTAMSTGTGDMDGESAGKWDWLKIQ